MNAPDPTPRPDERPTPDELLARALRRAEDPPAPPDLTRRVMDRIAALPRPAARAGRWRGLLRWALAPRPVRLAPVHAALGLAAAALLLAGVWLLRPAAPGPAPAAPAVAARFVLPDPAGRARSVAVVGSFNQWDAHGYDMRYDPAAKAWVLILRLAPGTHEYAFLVDGERVEPDPAARFSRDDGFGSRNSLLLLDGDGDVI
ncbi:MAG: glycogen-binding domain-containing protein [Desulfovibrionaceae bacterium]